MRGCLGLEIPNTRTFTCYHQEGDLDCVHARVWLGQDQPCVPSQGPDGHQHRFRQELLAVPCSPHLSSSAGAHQQELQLPGALQTTEPVFSIHANTFQLWVLLLDRIWECLGALDSLLELEQPCQHGTVPGLRNVGV